MKNWPMRQLDLWKHVDDERKYDELTNLWQREERWWTAGIWQTPLVLSNRWKWNVSIQISVVCVLATSVEMVCSVSALYNVREKVRIMKSIVFLFHANEVLYITFYFVSLRHHLGHYNKLFYCNITLKSTPYMYRSPWHEKRSFSTSIDSHFSCSKYWREFLKIHIDKF